MTGPGSSPSCCPDCPSPPSCFQWGCIRTGGTPPRSDDGGDLVPITDEMIERARDQARAVREARS